MYSSNRRDEKERRKKKKKKSFKFTLSLTGSLFVLLLCVVGIAVGFSLGGRPGNESPLNSTPPTGSTSTTTANTIGVESNQDASTNVCTFVSGSNLNKCFGCTGNKCNATKTCDDNWYCAFQYDSTCTPLGSLSCSTKGDCTDRLLNMGMNNTQYCYSCIESKCVVKKRCDPYMICDEAQCKCFTEEQYYFNGTHPSDSVFLYSMKTHLDNLPSNWVGDTRMAFRENWEGLEFAPCESNPSYRCIVSIRMRSSNITGRINDLYFGLLSEVRTIDMGDNNLYGELPDELPSTLRYLKLDKNYISGTMPNWSKYTSLHTIIIKNNGIDGDIGNNLPVYIFKFDASENYFAGATVNLGQRSQLTHLLVEDNSIESITSLPSSLKHLRARNNAFLDIEWDEVSSTSLSTIDISGSRGNVVKCPIMLFLQPNAITSCNMTGNSFECCTYEQCLLIKESCQIDCEENMYNPNQYWCGSYNVTI